MRLFQYWDTGEPPGEVAACISSVRDMNPEFEHLLFDRDSAAWFIGKRLGQREREAFMTLAVPAMQADYFRLCAVWAKGGVWLDADSRALRPLRTLMAEAPDGFISMFNRRLQNHLLIVRDAGSPFFRSAVELATRSVEARPDDIAYKVTGPWVLNLIWAVIDAEGAHDDWHLTRNPDVPGTPDAAAAVALYPGAAEAFAPMTRKHDFWTNQWIQEVEDAAYKATSKDWRRWSGPLYHPAPERS